MDSVLRGFGIGKSSGRASNALQIRQMQMDFFGRPLDGMRAADAPKAAIRRRQLAMVSKG